MFVVLIDQSTHKNREKSLDPASSSAPLIFYVSGGQPEEQQDRAGSVPWRCLSWSAADPLALMVTPRVPGGIPQPAHCLDLSAATNEAYLRPRIF